MQISKVSFDLGKISGNFPVMAEIIRHSFLAQRKDCGRSPFANANHQSSVSYV